MKHKRYARYRGFKFVRYLDRMEQWIDKAGEYFYYNIDLKLWTHNSNNLSR